MKAARTQRDTNAADAKLLVLPASKSARPPACLAALTPPLLPGLRQRGRRAARGQRPAVRLASRWSMSLCSRSSSLLPSLIADAWLPSSLLAASPAGSAAEVDFLAAACAEECVAGYSRSLAVASGVRGNESRHSAKGDNECQQTAAERGPHWGVPLNRQKLATISNST